MGLLHTEMTDTRFVYDDTFLADVLLQVLHTEDIVKRPQKDFNGIRFRL